MNKTFLNKMMPYRLAALNNSSMVNTTLRSFGASNAYGVKSKFEAAYNKKVQEMAKYPAKV